MGLDPASFSGKIDIYESSGLYSNSFIQKYIDPDNVIRRALPDDVFAEGICILNNILYCLTWQKSEIFALDLDLNLIYYKKFILFLNNF